MKHILWMSAKSALVSQIDFIASFARLTGVDFAHDEAPDSRDTLVALIGECAQGLDYTLGEAPGAMSIRRGPWKLIKFIRRSWGHNRTL